MASRISQKNTASLEMERKGTCHLHGDGECGKSMKRGSDGEMYTGRISCTKCGVIFCRNGLWKKFGEAVEGHQCSVWICRLCLGNCCCKLLGGCSLDTLSGKHSHCHNFRSADRQRKKRRRKHDDVNHGVHLSSRSLQDFLEKTSKEKRNSQKEWVTSRGYSTIITSKQQQHSLREQKYMEVNSNNQRGLEAFSRLYMLLSENNDIQEPTFKYSMDMNDLFLAANDKTIMKLVHMLINTRSSPMGETPCTIPSSNQELSLAGATTLPNCSSIPVLTPSLHCNGYNTECWRRHLSARHENKESIRPIHYLALKRLSRSFESFKDVSTSKTVEIKQQIPKLPALQFILK